MQSIYRIEYFDDQLTDPGSPVDKMTGTTKSVYEPAAIAHKNIHFMGVSMYCDEFPECHRTFSRESTNCTPPFSSGVSAMKSEEGDACRNSVIMTTIVEPKRHSQSYVSEASTIFFKPYWP